MYIMSEKIILNNWKTQMSAYEWRKKPFQPPRPTPTEKTSDESNPLTASNKSETIIGDQYNVPAKHAGDNDSTRLILNPSARHFEDIVFSSNFTENNGRCRNLDT